VNEPAEVSLIPFSDPQESIKLIQKEKFTKQEEALETIQLVAKVPTETDKEFTPCNIFRARKFLEQTYMIEDMREEFIQKELEKICKN